MFIHSAVGKTLGDCGRDEGRVARHELGDALLVVLSEVAAVEDCKELVAAHAVDLAELAKLSLRTLAVALK